MAVAAAADHRAVRTDAAPAPVGPYSQAVASGGFLFVAGQLGLDPGTGRLVEGGAAAQTRQALRNLAAIVEAAGTSLARVTKTTVFLADLDDFAEMNEVYAGFFPGTPPARSTFQVARLPASAAVEIEAIVALG
jgi:2-iminobutanoate/2-iminopropanoate deaminase